jgi:hypothetical protein
VTQQTMKGNRSTHGAKEDNSLHPELKNYRRALLDAGYKPDVVYGYVQGAKRYLEKGLPLDRESAKKWIAESKEAGHEIKGTHKTGVYSFIKFLCGDPLIRKNRKNKLGIDYQNICEEDCFNCTYKDCVRPDYMCKSIPYEQWVGRDSFEYDITDILDEYGKQSNQN